MRQTVVPFTVDVSSGRGCPESGLSLGSETDVTAGLKRCVDKSCLCCARVYQFKILAPRSWVVLIQTFEDIKVWSNLVKKIKIMQTSVWA